MPLESNIDDIGKWLEGVVDGIGFTLKGEDQSLGRDCAHLVAQRIGDRGLADESGPDGPWPPNEEKYAKRKQKLYGHQKPNVRTGQMLSQESLMGQTTITDDQVEMRYGIPEPPTRSAAPTGYLSRQDQEITDREKGQYCSESRPFYQLTEDDGKAVVNLVGEALAEYIRSRNRGS